MKISKMINFLCFVLSFALFFSLPVSAAQSIDSILTEDGFISDLGFTQDEFDALKDENGVVTFETPNALADAVIDEPIKLQEGGIYYNYVSDSGGAQGGFMSFGTTKVITGNARMLTITLFNNDYPLFNTPGELVLNCVLKAFKCNVLIEYADGTSSSELYQTDLTSSINQITIPNPYANIIKISIIQSNPVVSGDDLIISGGIQSYYYEFYGDNVFDLISNFFTTFFDRLGNLLGFVDNSDELDTSISNLETSENQLIDKAGNLDDITFSDDAFSNPSFLITVAFISNILQTLFVSTRFSVLFNITCTFLLIAIALGFARHWKGGSK